MHIQTSPSQHFPAGRTANRKDGHMNPTEETKEPEFSLSHSGDRNEK
jgi:hypothetical protein